MNGYEDSNDNKRKILIAIVIAVLILAIGVFVAVIIRRGRVPAGPGTVPNVNGTTTVPGTDQIGGGQDEAPYKERQFATPTDGPGDTESPDVEPPEPVDPTINRPLSEQEKIAAGFPVDAVVREQAFRDQNGTVYLENVIDHMPTDTDQDGISDAQEAQLGLNPSNPDTDDDGLSDGDEVNIYRTSPKAVDTDADGVSDFVEIRVRRTDPLRKPEEETQPEAFVPPLSVNGDETEE